MALTTHAITPVYSLAIATSDHKDDAKLSGALQKQREADPTLSLEQQQDTSETVLHGQGEMHLISTVDRLAKDYGLTEIEVKEAIEDYEWKAAA